MIPTDPFPEAHYDVIVVGAGAAGMMCAAEAAKRGRRTLVIDHAKAVGEKIRISGGGRCNFTNLHTAPDRYISRNPRFCISALSRYRPQDFIAMVERYGIAYHEKTLGQLFCDGSSKQIIRMLCDELAMYGGRVRLECSVQQILYHDGRYRLTLNDANTLSCAALVIATGGPSVPKMGATDWGCTVAKQFGLPVEPMVPALVPFTLEGDALQHYKQLAGVALPVTAECNGARFKEAMLFTHRGMSGPAILQISSYWRPGDIVHIDFLPERDALAELKTARQQQPKSRIVTWLSARMPARVAGHLCARQHRDTVLADCSNAALQAFSDGLHHFPLIPAGTEGLRTAEVCTGGVSTHALSSKTMEALSQPGLYFIGEVVDVTGWLGGYNFQWAWASGYAAGTAV